MFLEDFLYDHIGITVAAIMLGAQWATDHHLITGWHYKVCCLAATALALYLTAVTGRFTAWTASVCVAALFLAWHVYRTRPRTALDGSHEAL